MTHQIMIDIETLSTEPNAAILSIGAVLFSVEQKKIIRTFTINIKMESSINYGHISPETVQWWMEQPYQAREAFKNKGHSLLGALDYAELIGRIPTSTLSENKKHSALEDASFQAQQIIEIY